MRMCDSPSDRERSERQQTEAFALAYPEDVAAHALEAVEIAHDQESGQEREQVGERGQAADLEIVGAESTQEDRKDSTAGEEGDPERKPDGVDEATDKVVDPVRTARFCWFSFLFCLFFCLVCRVF